MKTGYSHIAKYHSVFNKRTLDGIIAHQKAEAEMRLGRDAYLKGFERKEP